MSNQEEEITKSQNTENNNGSNGENVSSQSGAHHSDDSASTSDEKIADPTHNTGNERMAVDEEGAEVGPDDEV